MSEPISVLIPLHAEVPLYMVKESVESMLNQSHQPDEILVVLDGEVDKKVIDLLYHYGQGNAIVKVVGYKERKGIAAALNYGLPLCRNNLVARMDADDVAVPQRLELQHKKWLSGNYGVIGGQILEFEPKQSEQYMRKVPLQQADMQKYSRFRSPFNHTTVMYDRRVIMEEGGYKNVFRAEDWHLWLRLFKTKKYTFSNLDQPLVMVRTHNYQRQNGISHFMHEAGVQLQFCREKLIPIHIMVFNLSLRFLFRVLPPALTSFMYKTLLRVKHSTQAV